MLGMDNGGRDERKGDGSSKREELATASLWVAGVLGVFTVALHAGSMMRYKGDAAYIVVPVLALAFPIFLLLLASRGWLAERVVLLACGLVFTIGSYFVVASTPNYVVPSNLVSSTAALWGFFSVVGATVAVFTLACTRASVALGRDPSYAGKLAVGTLVAGALSAAVLVPGLDGFLYSLVLANYAYPAFLGVYFYLSRRDPSRVPPEVHAFGVPESWARASLGVRLKSAKLFVHLLVVSASVAVALAINGVELSGLHYYEQGWLFYCALGLGGVAGGVAWRDDPGKVGRLEVAWVRLFTVQVCLLGGAVALEAYLPGFHDSLPAHAVDGFAVGFALTSLVRLVAALHPPKRVGPYLALAFFFLGVAVVVGTAAREAIVFHPSEWGDVQTVLSFVLTTVLCLSIVFLALNRGVLGGALAPRSRGRGEPRGGAEE
ncbi:MAG: hypothetical protein ACTSU5_18510 [Promethearchaeota archaeon]